MSRMKKAGGSKRRKQPIPRFRSVNKESDFWDTHSFLDYGDWEVVSYEDLCEEIGARTDTKIPVTFRLEKQLLRRLKHAARRHGIKYQVLVREILWRSLIRKAQ